MSTIRSSLAPDFASIDAEHRLQVNLASSLEAALKAGDGKLAGKILEKMTDLAEAHFLAEELLMRLHQYAGFHEHVAEHARLVEELRDLARRHAAGELQLGLDVASRLGESLASHIHGPDQRLSVALGRPAAPGPASDFFVI